MVFHPSSALLLLRLFAVPALGLALFAGDFGRAEDEPTAKAVFAKGDFPSTLEEARGRARWLHEVIHGALQVMHRDFFNEDDAGTLPSQSLDDVFKEMFRSHEVEIRWLGVNANRGKDHLPKDRFEEKASEALKSGSTEYEAVEGKRFRFVGMIRLQNECLKCHLPNRKTLEDRMSALAISFPMASPEQ
ncbi:MAG TPA: DUF3365 domain-containing protein [Bacteroidia bacterium]|nr:DUF3365 domain-containing protein [Bacteroidia bacterium]